MRRQLELSNAAAAALTANGDGRYHGVLSRVYGTGPHLHS